LPSCYSAELPARQSSQEQAEARAARDGAERMQAEAQRPAEAERRSEMPRRSDRQIRSEA